MTGLILCDAEELVELLKNGDAEVLDRVTRCYGQRLLMAARRYCRTEEEALDARQDAILNAWHYGPGFRNEGRVDRWLVRLVASACSRMRRGLKNDRNNHVTDEELLADQPSPEDLAARSELAQVLSGLLDQLKPQDRTLLILSDAHGWRGPELAQALNMSHSAVRSRLSRLHARLRDELNTRRVS